MILSFPGILLGFILLVKSDCPKFQTYFCLGNEGTMKNILMRFRKTLSTLKVKKTHN